MDDYKLGRIQRFDSDIEEMKKSSSVMKDISTEGSVVAVTHTGPDGLTGDLIDKMLYEFVECKVAISTIFAFNIPGGAQVTLNIDDKSIQWETEYNPNTKNTTVTLDFMMTADQRERQIAVLRENDIDGYILPLTADKESFIDYGELSSRGRVKFTIDSSQVKGWALRSEDCRVCISEVDKEYQDAFIHGIMIELLNPADDGHEYSITIAQCSVLPMFTEEDVENAIPFPHDNSDSVTILTNDDLACEPEPDGYNDWDGESKNEVFEKYRDKVIILKKRADQWRCIFAMKDQSEFTEWVHSIADNAVNGKLQVHIADFFAWLLHNQKYDAFMLRLNADLDVMYKEEAKKIVVSKLTSYIKSDETIMKLIEASDASRRLLIVMIDVMDSLKIPHDEDGVIDRSKVSEEDLEKFLAGVRHLPEKIEAERVVHELVVLIALDGNLITKEQASLPKEELEQMESYQTIFTNIAAIVREFKKTSEEK